MRVKARNKMQKCVCCFTAACVLLTSLPVSAKEQSIKALEPEIQVVYSSYNDLDLRYGLTDLTQEKGLRFTKYWGDIDSTAIPIVVDPSVTYQKWEGFGGSIDGATIYKYQQLNEGDRQQLIRDLFGEESGNAYNMMRLSIACSDFTIDAPEAGQYGDYPDYAGGGYWTYNDDVDEDTDGNGIADSDFDLSNFTIQKDIDNGTIAFIKAAQQENPNIKFFASMWSPPAWMKKNQSIIWNESQEEPEIREDCYEVLAEYYCRFIESYRQQGIEIYAVTLQNEPDIKVGYPCAIFTPENQIKFALCLNEAFERHGINTKIWGMDANEFETWQYAVPLLNSDAGAAVDGIAFHNYGGIEMLYPNSLAEEYPSKTYHITEMTVGGTKLIEYLRNNISTYSYWITYYDLDMQNRTYGPGPSFWSMPQSNDADHWSLSQLSDNGNGGYQCNAKYYTFGQFSRFIDTGSIRIDSSDARGNISNVAFQNPDGTISLIVVNRANTQNTNEDPDTPNQKIVIETPQGAFSDTIPGDTIATYTWNIETGNYLERDSWSVSASNEHSGFKAYQAIDDSGKTLWFSGKHQEEGDAILLDLGQSENFTAISLFNGDQFKNDYPKAYKVQLSDDGSSWREAARGNGSNGITNIEFDGEQRARYIKLLLTENKDNWWNISNIAVFSANNNPSIQLSAAYQKIEDKSSWTVEATSNRIFEEKAPEIVDGNIDTVWAYQNAQEEGFYVQIDMGGLYEISNIEIEFGNSEDYARGFQLQVSQNGTEWSDFGAEMKFEPQRDGTGNITSGLAIVRNDALVNARYIRMVLTENVSNHWLCIAEISVNEGKDDVVYEEDKTGWFSVSQLYDYSDVSQAIFDGSINTRWSSNRAQEPGDSINMDFITPRTFNYIDMECKTDYPRGYRVLASADGTEYTEIASGSGNSGNIVVVLDTPVTAKCIRLELTESCDNSWWSIYELNLGMKYLPGSPVLKNGWIAYTSRDGIEVERYAIDGNLATCWQSEEVQQAVINDTTAYLLNMGSARQICGISINSGSEMWSYLEEYEVYAWKDGEEARLVASGYGNKALTQIYFPAVEAKYIWIRSAATSQEGRKFAIAELNVYTQRIK